MLLGLLTLTVLGWANDAPVTEIVSPPILIHGRRPTDPNAWRSQLRVGEIEDVYGITRVEAHLASSGARASDVKIVQGSITRLADASDPSGMSATAAAIALTNRGAARTSSDRQVSQLVALRGDGGLVSPGELCAVDAANDSPMSLTAWIEPAGLGDRVADTDRRTRSGRQETLLIDTPNGRSALVHLEPGDSATVVSIVGNVRSGQARRALVVSTPGRRLSVVQRKRDQQTCLAWKAGQAALGEPPRAAIDLTTFRPGPQPPKSWMALEREALAEMAPPPLPTPRERRRERRERDRKLD